MTLDTREGIKARNSDLKVAQSAQSVIIKQVMSTGDGRKWIADLFTFCHIFDPCFSSDPSFTSFMLGERNVGLQILAAVTSACPQEYLLLLQEQGEKDGRRAERDNGTNNPGGDGAGGESDLGDTGDGAD